MFILPPAHKGDKAGDAEQKAGMLSALSHLTQLNGIMPG